MVSLGRVTVLVDDLDAAVAFYARAFDFRTLFDGEVAPGVRTVHIGPGDTREASLWLIRATDPDTTARIGRQTAGEPTLVFYTNDLAADLARLAALQVTPLRGPDSDPSGSSFAHIRDNSGNEIVLVQLPPAAPRSNRPDRPFTIGYLEFATDDPARSADFYAALFGWDVARGAYTTFHTGNLKGGFPDTLHGYPPLRAVLEPGDTLVYVDVTDLVATLDKARTLGARVLLEPVKPGPGHLLAVIADPAGVKIALGQSDWA